MCLLDVREYKGVLQTNKVQPGFRRVTCSEDARPATLQITHRKLNTLSGGIDSCDRTTITRE
jgi:hypothetical protein